MATLSSMRLRIEDDLNRKDVSSQITLAINRAIRHYRKNNFWFTETSGTFSTVASQKSYGTSDGIPSDIQKIDYMKATISNTDYELLMKTFQEIEAIDPSSYTGYPQIWAWYQEKIFLYPVPNDAYTVTLFYQKNYSDLSADNDTNDFLDEAEDLIESRASWWVLSRIIKDVDASIVAKQEEMEALRSLVDQHRKFVSSGFIRPQRY